MAQAIKQHALAAAGQHAHDGEVRHVAAAEKQRALAAGELRELLFEGCVLGPVAGDEVRGTAAGAPQRRARRHRLRQRRVAGKA